MYLRNACGRTSGSCPRSGSDGAHAGVGQQHLRLRELVLNTGRKPLPAAPETAVRFVGNGSNIIYIDWTTTSSPCSAGFAATSSERVIREPLMAVDEDRAEHRRRGTAAINNCEL